MKAYLITYATEDADRITNFPREIGMLGNSAMVHGDDAASTISVVLIPSNENLDAKDIKGELVKKIDVFADSLLVTQVNPLNIGEKNCVAQAISLLEHGDKNESEEIRNFSRFHSRHEGIVQYQKEKPQWAYESGILANLPISFEEWCWLPIKRDGIYDKNKYEKYIRGS